MRAESAPRVLAQRYEVTIGRAEMSSEDKQFGILVAVGVSAAGDQPRRRVVTFVGRADSAAGSTARVSLSRLMTSMAESVLSMSIGAAWAQLAALCSPPN